MLEIKNFDKLLNHCITAGSRVIVTEIYGPNIPRTPLPQRTYDICVKHKDRPGREFLLCIDRETPEKFLGVIQYHISFCEIGSGAKSFTGNNARIWHTNLTKPNMLLDFIDTLIQTYTK